MKNFFNLIILGLIVFNVGCSQTNKQKSDNEDVMSSEQNEPVVSSAQTTKVLNHHLTAFGANNLDSIMADYTNESIVATPDSTYIGLEPIKAFFAGILPSFPSEGTSTEIDRISVENELAYIVWHAKTPTVEVPFGSDTFIIKDGKIKMQTFAGVMNPIK